MASQTGVGKYFARGVNLSNRFSIVHVMAAALSSAETITLTLPDGVGKQSLPVAWNAWSTATPALPRGNDIANALVLTSHNRTTGETVFTVGSGGLAAGVIIVVDYAEIPA